VYPDPTITPAALTAVAMLGQPVKVPRSTVLIPVVFVDTASVPSEVTADADLASGPLVSVHAAKTTTEIAYANTRFIADPLLPVWTIERIRILSVSASEPYPTAVAVTFVRTARDSAVRVSTTSAGGVISVISPLIFCRAPSSN
jgi:hypothetical protein